MNVFISWSGTDSKKLGEALRNWLPAVLQLVKPYFTPSDIEKGTRWDSEIAKELESSEVGILCVTRDNLHSDWIMFEAGALSKSLDKAHVCPVLFGIQNTDLAGPLRQFQTTQFEKEEFRKLVSLINAKLGENKLAGKVLDSVFEKWWPELETEVNKILAELDEGDREPIRSERELLVEILELTRTTAQNVRIPPIPITSKPFLDLVQKYIALHDSQALGEGGYQETLDALQAMKKAIEYLARHLLMRRPEFDSVIGRLDALSFRYEKQEKRTPIPRDDIPF